MERIPGPRELRSAAALAQAVAYVAGVAGVVAGALLYREGQTGFAIVAWTLTFAAGAVLMIAAFLARAAAAVLARLARIEQDVAVLVARDREGRAVPDPWSRHRSPY
ncbi:MAG: hypothetical protein M3133_00470 [Actinomycetota bacterium]|nr:hypothetical protein [Actinomycetota bacterium]